MAGIRDEVDVDSGARPGDVFSSRTHVIFHITAAQHTPRIHVFKARENLFRRSLCDMDDHIQPATMRHPHDEFDCAALSGSVQDFIH